MQRLFTYICTLITLSCSSSYAAHLYPELEPETPAWCQLHNGFQVVNYGPVGSPELITLTLQVYVGWSHEHRDQAGIAELVRQCIWQGTTEHSRIQILNTLDALHMDHEQNGYTLPDSTIYTLNVPMDDAPALEMALYLLSHMAFNATLVDRDIEIVRQYFFEDEQPLRYVFNLVDPQHYAYMAREAIRHASPDRVRTFYSNAYSPGNMVLHVTGPIPDQELFAGVEWAFGQADAAFDEPESGLVPDFRPLPENTPDLGQAPTNEVAKFIQDRQQSGESLFRHNGIDYELVDGKILMQQASWYETRFGRRIVTWGSFGAGLAAIWFGTQNRISELTWGGVALEGVGLYGLTCFSYDKDPQVIRELRADLLQHDFSDAIEHSNVQLLLTPLELRQLFINEHTQRPNVGKVSKQYDLFRSPFTDMFTREELELLRDGVAAYRHEAGELRRLRRSLDERLQDALAPARTKRDRLLARIEQEYESNYFVVEERHLADQRAAILRDARVAYDQRVLDARYSSGHISATEVEERIQDAQRDLDYKTGRANEQYRRSVMGAIEVGLTQARNIRDSARAEVQNSYTNAVARAQAAIGYSEERRQLQEAQAELDSNCNASLSKALGRFVIAPGLIRDYVLSTSIEVA